MFWIGVAIIGGLLVLYAGWLVFSSYLSVKAAPREPMEWCPVHGPIRKQYMITFMGMPYCAICFHNRLRTAERSGKPNGR